EQRHLRVPSSHQAFQSHTACIHVLFHGRSGAGKVIGIELRGDLGEVATAKVECKADEGIELVLIELGAPEHAMQSGTNSNRDVVVDAILKGISVAVEKLLAKSLGDRRGEIAFSCLLAGMAVTNGSHPLDTKS
ncbi:MAG: hypothetical protein Q9176_003988, partial [Flavoplaca citrina]